MESINLLLFETISKFFNEMVKAISKIIAEVIEEKNEKTVRLIHDRYIRPVQESTLMRKVDVARRLNVSPSTVTQLIDCNALKSTSDGRVSEFSLWQYITDDGKNLCSEPNPVNPSNQPNQIP